jgi:nucleoside-diphosphate-sugar epimerase
MIKNILVTGNLGYIGSVLTPLLSKKYDITGFDIGYFKDCLLEKEKKNKKFKTNLQRYKSCRG